MRNINKVILIGNVARAPELRETAGGQKMVTFVLATNRTWYDPDGKKQSQVEFHNIVAWGKVAEICNRFLQKSTLMYIEGYLKTRSWDGEDDNKLYRTEIVAQDVLVLSRGIRYDEHGHDDYDNDHDRDNTSSEEDQEDKPASEIEKSFHEKLAAGNATKADVDIANASRGTNADFSLDDPLFEEEQK